MIGNVVGSYKITEKIGEGGMGAVFKGVDLMLEREVAIKMLRPELASQPQVVERFRSEAVTLAKLNHPNIATLHSFFRQGEDFFMVLEFVRGQTLDDVIRRNGAIGWERAVTLFCQALEGIDHAHKLGIIHRDVKPANMMLTETGTIKVMDFGIARVLGTARMTRQGNIVGTIEYMSPEQVRGEETGASSDIYSLGILLYEMLTGRVPFSSPSEFDLMKSQIEDAPPPPTRFTASIPPVIEEAIMRSLAKRPTARFQSAGEFRAVLLGALNAGATPAERAHPGYVAPATRLGEPPAAGGLKETRLAPGAGGNYQPSAPAHFNDAQPKETRLGAGTGAQAPYMDFSNVPTIRTPSHDIAGQAAQASLLSKLNWKHYAGAGVAILALLGVPLAFMGGGSQPAQPQNLTPPSASAPAPAPAQSQAPAQAVTDPTNPPKLDTGSTPADTSPTEASKTSRTRGGRAEKVAESSAPAATAQPQPVVTAPPPKPQPREEPKVVAKEPEKEEKKEEKKEKKKGLFGKIKDAVGDAIKKEAKKKN